MSPNNLKGKEKAMMRVFFTTTIKRALRILKDGFTDADAGEPSGIFVSEHPIYPQNGFAGEVLLVLLVPVEVFNTYECIISADLNSDLHVRSGGAMVPADALNDYGPAQVYDHKYAGLSRHDLMVAFRDARSAGNRKEAAALRRAIRFLIATGWQTPLWIQERPHDWV